jgi:hypothetical protein
MEEASGRLFHMDRLSLGKLCVLVPTRHSAVFIFDVSFSQIIQTNQADINGGLTDKEKAIRLMSAYIERCRHFFALCPSVHSRDKRDAKYDYGSWLASGDCRMELFALLLARNNCIPAVVSFVFRV